MKFDDIDAIVSEIMNVNGDVAGPSPNPTNGGGGGGGCCNTASDCTCTNCTSVTTCKQNLTCY